MPTQPVVASQDVKQSAKEAVYTQLRSPPLWSVPHARVYERPPVLVYSGPLIPPQEPEAVAAADEVFVVVACVVVAFVVVDFAVVVFAMVLALLDDVVVLALDEDVLVTKVLEGVAEAVVVTGTTELLSPSGSHAVSTPVSVDIAVKLDLR